MIKEIKVVLQEFDPGANQLRIFGLLLSAIFFAFHVYFLSSPLLILFGLSAVLLSIAAPNAYLPLVKSLVAVTYPLGFIISKILLILFYLLLLTPIGTLRRWLGGKDWKIARQTSYWQSVESNVNHDRMSL